MKRFLNVYFLIFLFVCCNVSESGEKQAILVCQNAKVQLQSSNVFATAMMNAYGLGTNSTWLDFANVIAKRDPNTKYDWHSKKSDDGVYYIVDFTDHEGWGHRWEVDVEQQIVKNINQNEFLSRKYGFTRFGGNENFDVTDIEKSDLKKDYDGVYYLIKASVLNKTDKTIVSASVDGKLKLIFKDKVIAGEGNYESGFRSRVSERNAWRPNTTKEFYIKTKGIEDLYLDYIPEYVVFAISLKAEDPIGFSFDKDILDMDLLSDWKSLKSSAFSNTSESEGQWKLFWEQFRNAVAKKDKATIAKLTASEFFSGGGGMTLSEWLDSMVFVDDNSFSDFKKTLDSGVKNFTGSNGAIYKATGNSEYGDLFFDYIDGQWKFGGVVGD